MTCTFVWEFPVILSLPSLNCPACDGIEAGDESDGGTSGEMFCALYGVADAAINAKASAIVLTFIKHREANAFFIVQASHMERGGLPPLPVSRENLRRRSESLREGFVVRPSGGSLYLGILLITNLRLKAELRTLGTTGTPTRARHVAEWRFQSA